MIRRLAAFAILLAASGAGPCLAQEAPSAATARLDPRNLALAEQIIDLSYPPETRHAMMSRATDAMMDQAETAVTQMLGDHMDAGTERIFDRYMDRVREQSEALIADGSPAIFTAFARAYARQFTHDELVEIRAFVATPTGAKYVQQSVELLSDPDVAQANTAYMAEAFGAMLPLQEQLFRELNEYIESRDGRPDDAPSTGTR